MSEPSLPQIGRRWFESLERLVRSYCDGCGIEDFSLLVVTDRASYLVRRIVDLGDEVATLAYASEERSLAPAGSAGAEPVCPLVAVRYRDVVEVHLLPRVPEDVLEATGASEDDPIGFHGRAGRARG